MKLAGDAFFYFKNNIALEDVRTLNAFSANHLTALFLGGRYVFTGSIKSKS